MDVSALASLLLVGAGALLALIASLGVLRFPDFYTRLHAAGVTDTLCAALFLLGLMLHFGLTLASAKLAMILVLLLFTTPTACHALAKAALRSGLQPWTPGQPDLPLQPATPASRRARSRRRRR